MADRGHADGDQVLGRQVRQDVSVDEIVAECQLVLLKTKLLKPTRDINRHLKCQSRRKPSIRRLRRGSNGRGRCFLAGWHHLRSIWMPSFSHKSNFMMPGVGRLSAPGTSWLMEISRFTLQPEGRLSTRSGLLLGVRPLLERPQAHLCRSKSLKLSIQSLIVSTK